MLLPVTLCAAAAAALITLWLGLRIGQIRASQNVIHGDGGVPLLTRRMRAQLNFVEYTPFVLVLIAAIEIAGKGGNWLAWVTAAYFVGRVLHPFGMDAEGPHKARAAGVILTLLVLLGLAIVAVLVATERM